MPNFWDKVRRGLGDEDEDLSALVPGVDLEMASFTPQPLLKPSSTAALGPRPAPPTPVSVAPAPAPALAMQQRIRLPGILPLGVTPYYREVYGTFAADGSSFFFATPVTAANTPLLTEQIPANTYLVVRRFVPYILEQWDSPTAPTTPDSMAYSQHFVASITSKLSGSNSNELGFALLTAAGVAYSITGGTTTANDSRTQSTSIFNRPAFDPEWSFIATPNESLVINIRSKVATPFSFWGGGTQWLMAGIQLFGWWVPQALYEQMVK